MYIIYVIVYNYDSAVYIADSCYCFIMLRGSYGYRLYGVSLSQFMFTPQPHH